MGRHPAVQTNLHTSLNLVLCHYKRIQQLVHVDDSFVIICYQANKSCVSFINYFGESNEHVNKREHRSGSSSSSTNGSGGNNSRSWEWEWSNGGSGNSSGSRNGRGAQAGAVAVGVETTVAAATTAGAGVRETVWRQQLREQEHK